MKTRASTDGASRYRRGRQPRIAGPAARFEGEYRHHGTHQGCSVALFSGPGCLGVAGYQQPVFWGVYIVTFVFWIGIGHAGTLISAILFLFRAKWRNAVNRGAEALTVFAVITAALFPILHLGRIWKLYFLIPYPNQRELWVNFKSPLLWDVFAISTYASISIVFFYVGLIPDIAIEWGTTHIESKYVFLLALNVFLLLVGCLMDIYSAIVVVVPLLLPLGIAFGIDPVHLGIIFLANLELGYLTPPVGLNLFLSAYRFKRPVMEVARASLPMLLVVAISVILITYMPFLTTFLPNLILGSPGGP